MLRRRKTDWRTVDGRTLLANLYATQGLVLGLALLVIWRQNRPIAGLFAVAPGNAGSVLLHGVLAAAAVLAADGALTRLFPGRMKDESGLDERLFAKRPVWHLAIMCLAAAVSEELLFRGALQHAIGIFWTSVLFAAVHVRYLRKGLPALMLFGASLALGWIQERTGSLAAPVTAHFLIDFVNGLLLRRKASHD